MKQYRKKFIEDMELKDFAEATKKMYFAGVKRFFDRMEHKKLPLDVTELDIRNYFLYLKNDLKYGVSSLKIAVSCLRFFLGRH